MMQRVQLINSTHIQDKKKILDKVGKEENSPNLIKCVSVIKKSKQTLCSMLKL